MNRLPKYFQHTKIPKNTNHLFISPVRISSGTIKVGWNIPRLTEVHMQRNYDFHQDENDEDTIEEDSLDESLEGYEDFDGNEDQYY